MILIHKNCFFLRIACSPTVRAAKDDVLENQEVISVVELGLLAKQTIAVACTSPKIIPGW